MLQILLDISYKYMIQFLLEQWSLTGGRDNSLAISEFFIFPASAIYKTQLLQFILKNIQQDTVQTSNLL